jgi:hypothetical protein
MFFQEPFCYDPQIVFVPYFILTTYQIILWYCVVIQIWEHNWVI